MRQSGEIAERHSVGVRITAERRVASLAGWVPVSSKYSVKAKTRRPSGPVGVARQRP